MSRFASRHRQAGKTSRAAFGSHAAAAVLLIRTSLSGTIGGAGNASNRVALNQTAAKAALRDVFRRQLPRPDYTARCARHGPAPRYVERAVRARSAATASATSRPFASIRSSSCSGVRMSLSTLRCGFTAFRS